MGKKIFIGTLIMVLFNVVALYAQTDPGEPCNGNDIDTICPLDTWVMGLAVIAVLFAAVHLHRKQKAALVLK